MRFGTRNRGKTNSRFVALALATRSFLYLSEFYCCCAWNGVRSSRSASLCRIFSVPNSRWTCSREVACWRCYQSVSPSLDALLFGGRRRIMPGGPRIALAAASAAYQAINTFLINIKASCFLTLTPLLSPCCFPACLGRMYSHFL